MGRTRKRMRTNFMKENDLKKTILRLKLEEVWMIWYWRNLISNVLYIQHWCNLMSQWHKCMHCDAHLLTKINVRLVNWLIDTNYILLASIKCFTIERRLYTNRLHEMSGLTGPSNILKCLLIRVTENQIWDFHRTWVVI